MKTVCLILCSFVFFSCEKNATPVEEENRAGRSLEAQIQPFLTYKQIFGDADPQRVQDFDLDSRYLYVHPTGAYGLYRFSLSDSLLTELVNYPSGDFIAHDSLFIFYDLSGWSVYRFNLAKNEVDLQLDLSSLDYTNISGMDIEDHTLYILLFSQTSRKRFLAQFTLDGVLIRTIDYDGASLRIAVRDRIVYGLYYPDEEHLALSRFDLSTGSFMEDYVFPTWNWDGFRVIDGDLYFADFEQEKILRVPLSALRQ